MVVELKALSFTCCCRVQGELALLHAFLFNCTLPFLWDKKTHKNKNGFAKVNSRSQWMASPSCEGRWNKRNKDSLGTVFFYCCSP